MSNNPDTITNFNMNMNIHHPLNVTPTTLLDIVEKYLLGKKSDKTIRLVKKVFDGIETYYFESSINMNRPDYPSGFYEQFISDFIEDFNEPSLYDNNTFNVKPAPRFYELDSTRLIGYVVQHTPTLEEFKKYYRLAINKNSVIVSRFIKKYEDAIKFAQKKQKLININNPMKKKTGTGMLSKLEKHKACLHYLIAQGMNYSLADKNNNPQNSSYILPPVATLHAMRPLELNYEQFKALTFEHFNHSLNIECVPQASRLSLANQMMKNEDDRKHLAQCLGVQDKESYQSMVESDKPVSAIYLDNLANMHEYDFYHVNDFQKYIQSILLLLKKHCSELGLEDINFIQNAQHLIIFVQSQNQNQASTTLLKKVISQTLVLFRNKKENVSENATTLKELDEMFDNDEINEKNLGFKISHLILKCKLDMEAENSSKSNNNSNGSNCSDDENEIIKL